MISIPKHSLHLIEIAVCEVCKKDFPRRKKALPNGRKISFSSRRVDCRTCSPKCSRDMHYLKAKLKVKKK